MLSMLFFVGLSLNISEPFCNDFSTIATFFASDLFLDLCSANALLVSSVLVSRWWFTVLLSFSCADFTSFASEFLFWLETVIKV